LTLATLGSKAKAAVPELMKLAGGSERRRPRSCRNRAVEIERYAGVFRCCERMETATDYQTLIRVMNLLGEIGPAAKLAVPVIQRKSKIQA